MKKDWLKKGLVITTIAWIAAASAACSKGAGTTDTSAAEPAGTGTDPAAGTESAEIKFSWWGGDARHEATEKAVTAFMAKYPDIKVDVEYGAWNGWEEKQTLALTGGNAADCMQINWNWIDAYSGNGENFYDLRDYADVIDLTQYTDEQLEQCSAGGKLVGIPVAVTGRLFYWNKTTFDEVGCAFPTDKDSLFAAGEAFRAYNEDYYPLALTEYDRMIFMVYYLESVYNKPWVQDGQIQYSKEEIQEGLDLISEMEAKHVIPTIAVLSGDMSDSLDKNSKWIDGQYAGIWEWDSSASKFNQAVSGSVNKPDQEMVVGDFIKFGEYQGGFTAPSMCLAIPKTSQYPKQAATLINYLLNDPEGIEICSTERGIPCSKAAISVLEEKNLGDAMVKEANAKVVAYSKFAMDPKFQHNDLKANPDGVYFKVFGKLSAGDYNSDEAAQVLIDGVNECLGN